MTADHGVRFAEEDSRFRPGTIDDYTFHLPLLLYAPPARRDTKFIEWATSHIDIQPSILDLLGVDRGRQFEQGSPIWNEALARRTVFFWAGRALGADGFHRGGEYFMWNRLRDTVYRNSIMRFSEANRVRDQATAHSVMEEIEKMDLLRRSWLRCALEGCSEE